MSTDFSKNSSLAKLNSLAASEDREILQSDAMSLADDKSVDLEIGQEEISIEMREGIDQTSGKQKKRPAYRAKWSKPKTLTGKAAVKGKPEASSGSPGLFPITLKVTGNTDLEVVNEIDSQMWVAIKALLPAHLKKWWCDSRRSQEDRRKAGKFEGCLLKRFKASKRQGLIYC